MGKGHAVDILNGALFGITNCSDEIMIKSKCPLQKKHVQFPNWAEQKLSSKKSYLCDINHGKFLFKT